MSRRRLALVALMLGFLARVAWGQPSDAPARVTDVVVQAVDDTVTVSIATTGAPKYRSELMDSPFRLVFDFESTLYGWKKAPVSVGTDPVKEVRGSQYRVGMARLVIELTRRATYRIEPQAGGIRVVFAPPTKAAPPTATAPTETAPARTAKPTVPATWGLQGIVLSNDAAIAYIADPATNQVKRYAVGDRIGDGLVEAIEENRVVLRMPRGGVELRFEERRPAPRPEQ